MALDDEGGELASMRVPNPEPIDDPLPINRNWNFWTGRYPRLTEEIEDVDSGEIIQNSPIQSRPIFDLRPVCLANFVSFFHRGFFGGMVQSSLPREVVVSLTCFTPLRAIIFSAAFRTSCPSPLRVTISRQFSWSR